MAILIAGYIDLAPDDATRIIHDAQPLIAAALNEPGCRSYSWAHDPTYPGRVHVFEEWDDEASLAFHFMNRPYTMMGEQLRDGAGILGFMVRKFRCDHAEPVYDQSGAPRADFFQAPTMT